MTINWLIFKNGTCFALRRLPKYQACLNLYFFRQPSNGRLDTLGEEEYTRKTRRNPSCRVLR